MNRILAYIAFTLGILQIAVVLISWLVTAAMPELGFHSLLSAEGVRWYFGGVLDNMTSTSLTSIVLLSSGCGAIWKSGLWSVFFRHPEYQEKLGLRLALMELLLGIVIMFLLSAVPHAILLSVTGNFFPSSFSRSIVPVITLIFWVMSESYSLIVRNSHVPIEKMFNDFVFGISWAAPIIFIFIVATQLYYSFCFVF